MTVDEHGVCSAHADFDPFSPLFLADPLAVLGSLPPETQVFYAPSIDYYVVTRYADIEAVFLDHETYSAAPAQAVGMDRAGEAPEAVGHEEQLLRPVAHGAAKTQAGASFSGDAISPTSSRP